jgi:hypothetical protein
MNVHIIYRQKISANNVFEQSSKKLLLAHDNDRTMATVVDVADYD